MADRFLGERLLVRARFSRAQRLDRAAPTTKYCECGREVEPAALACSGCGRVVGESSASRSRAGAAAVVDSMRARGVSDGEIELELVRRGHFYTGSEARQFVQVRSRLNRPVRHKTNWLRLLGPMALKVGVAGILACIAVGVAEIGAFGAPLRLTALGFLGVTLLGLILQSGFLELIYEPGREDPGIGRHHAAGPVEPAAEDSEEN